MLYSEFKSWFKGYSENMEGPPSHKQWERICKRVDEIDGITVTERVFVDRYWPTYWPAPVWPYHSTTWVAPVGVGRNSSAFSLSVNNSLGAQSSYGSGGGGGGSGPNTFYATPMNNCGAGGAATPAEVYTVSLPAYDSHAAMYGLGKSEYENVS